MNLLQRFPRPTRARLAALLCMLVLTSLAGPLLGSASAASSAHHVSTAPKGVAAVGPPIFPLASLSVRPAGFAINGAQALAIAKHSPVALAVHRRFHPLNISVEAWLGSH